MTCNELIELLQEAVMMNDGNDCDVRLAEQPKWAFEYNLRDEWALTRETESGKELEDGEQTPQDEDGHPVPVTAVCYLAEGNQIGYLPAQAAEQLNW